LNKNKRTVKEDEIDLRKIFEVFIKRKWLFISSVLIVFLVSLIPIFFKTGSYSLSYQIEIKEEYKNEDLFNLYPSYLKELNFFTLEWIPTIFNSPEIFKSVKEILEDIDINALIKSNAVTIEQIGDVNVYNVTVSDPDYNLANEISKTLIQSFQKYVSEREDGVLDKVLDKIDSDIEDLEVRNNNLKSEKVYERELEIESLYEELDRYLIDYNVDSVIQLKGNEESSDYNFYNIVIPPNKISDRIEDLNKEIQIYRSEIIENEKKLFVLNNIHKNLLKDKDLIINRVSLISSEPVYEIVSNSKIRNLLIAIVLSLISSTIIIFVADFIFNLKARKDKK